MSGETIPYRPSNGTEGEAFEARWCRRCEYDLDAHLDEPGVGCSILGRVMAFGIGDPDYPAEWISDPDHSNPRCSHFRKIGTGTHAKAAEQISKYESAMAEMRASQR